MANIAPTKANLIKSRESLNFSRKGFELLDKKRNVLIRELMEHVDKAAKIEEKVNEIFAAAYEALMKANLTIGISDVSDIAVGVPEARDFEVIYKSVMGVEVPHINYEFKNIEPRYGFYRNNSAVDLAFEKFNEVKYLIYELAETENAIYRLAIEVKKTQKKANALENIQIPKFVAIVKSIMETLEEKEREDFFRLKIVKKKTKKEI